MPEKVPENTRRTPATEAKKVLADTVADLNFYVRLRLGDGEVRASLLVCPSVRWGPPLIQDPGSRHRCALTSCGTASARSSSRT